MALMRGMTHGNTFISAYLLNWYWWWTPATDHPTLPTSAVTLSNECSCATRSDCLEVGGIHPNLTGEPFFLPCLAETLLRSTFECFYNQTCIDQLQSCILADQGFYRAVPAVAMNPRLPSGFQTQTSIRDIVDTFFFEQTSPTRYAMNPALQLTVRTHWQSQRCASHHNPWVRSLWWIDGYPMISRGGG